MRSSKWENTCIRIGNGGQTEGCSRYRVDQDTLIIARTDAIAVEGFQCALERAEKYLEAGADVLFVEAPENRHQMEKMNLQFSGRVPLLLIW